MSSALICSTPSLKLKRGGICLRLMWHHETKQPSHQLELSCCGETEAAWTTTITFPASQASASISSNQLVWDNCQTTNLPLTAHLAKTKISQRLSLFLGIYEEYILVFLVEHMVLGVRLVLKWLSRSVLTTEIANK